MKMTDASLLAFLEAEQDSAFHFANGALAQERSRSLREYMRLPYGNEEEGRAQVIASDVFDMVEGILPDLLDVFVSSDKAVVFEPTSAEDVKGAEQATAACNYVFYKQNNGFHILYTAAKDALMLKTGGVHWCWEEKRVAEYSTHTADEMQIAMHLMSNPDVEVMEQTDAEPDPQAEAQYAEAQAMAAQQGVELPPMPKRLTVKLKKITKRKRVRVSAFAPDELHVSTRHESLLLDECPYVALVRERTLSDLLEMGFDVTIEDVRRAQNEIETEDREERDHISEGRYGKEDDNELDPAMVRGWLREEYALVDFDGDGIAERRRIFRLGSKILENKECSHVQIAAWTPFILTHKFHGISIADLVGEFQRISTDIWRGQLDSLSLANNQETVVLTGADGVPRANLDDLLNRRPGGVMRESVPGAIRPYNERWQGIEAMPMVEMVRMAREQRTGYRPFTNPLDADSLQKTATQVTKESNGAQKRMKLMARIMAEALVAPMFRGIFKTLLDYGMEPLSFKLAGDFVQLNPQEWRDQYDMTINVGIGTGDTAEQLMFLQQVAAAQMALLQSPMGGRVVTEVNVYNTHAAIAERAGFKTPGQFWTDPSKLPPPPPAPPPLPLQIKQMELQADAQKFQAETMAEKERDMLAHQAKLAEIQATLTNQATNDARDAEREQQRQMMEASLKQAEQTAKQQEVAIKAEIEKYKADLQSQTQLKLARMNGAVDIDVAPIEERLNQLTVGLNNVSQYLMAPAEIVRDPVTGKSLGIRRVLPEGQQ
jgi:hypothetical protein